MSPFDTQDYKLLFMLTFTCTHVSSLFKNKIYTCDAFCKSLYILIEINSLVLLFILQFIYFNVSRKTFSPISFINNHNA